MKRHHKVGFSCFSVGYAEEPMATPAPGTETLRAGNISTATCRTTMQTARRMSLKEGGSQDNGSWSLLMSYF